MPRLYAQHMVKLEVLRFDSAWFISYEGLPLNALDEVVATAVADPNVRGVRVYHRKVHEDETPPEWKLLHLIDMSWKKNWEKLS